MNANTARAIITQARDDETYEDEIPEDDDKAIEVAEQLVQLARDAIDQGIQGPEVMAIVNLADNAEAEVEAPAPKSKPKPAAAAKPRPGRPARSEPEPEPEPEEEADPRAQTEPWEGYDADGVAEVKEAVEIWAEAENWDDLTHVLVYEEAHKNRKRIVEAITAVLPADETDAEEESEPAESEEEPEEEATPDPHEEPFEGYDSLKISEIKAALDEYLEQDDVADADKLQTLEQTYSYEAVNKTRSSLLDYIDEKKAAYAQAEGGEEDEAAAEAGEGDPEDAAAHDVDSGGEVGAPSGAGDGEAPRRSSPEGAGRNGVLTLTATLHDSDVEIALEGKYAIVGLVLDMIERGATQIVISG